MEEAWTQSWNTWARELASNVLDEAIDEVRGRSGGDGASRSVALFLAGVIAFVVVRHRSQQVAPLDDVDPERNVT